MSFTLRDLRRVNQKRRLCLPRFYTTALQLLRNNIILVITKLGTFANFKRIPTLLLDGAVGANFKLLDPIDLT